MFGICYHSKYSSKFFVKKYIFVAVGSSVCKFYSHLAFIRPKTYIDGLKFLPNKSVINLTTHITPQQDKRGFSPNQVLPYKNRKNVRQHTNRYERNHIVSKSHAVISWLCRTFTTVVWNTIAQNKECSHRTLLTYTVQLNLKTFTDYFPVCKQNIGELIFCGLKL